MKTMLVLAYLVILMIPKVKLNAQKQAYLNHHTSVELNLNALQLNSSIVEDILGGQFRINYFLQERIELINNTTLLTRSGNQFFQNDLRLRFWGGGAGSWHPGFAVELGHLYQNEDWLYNGSETSTKNQNGFLFGGT